MIQPSRQTARPILASALLVFAIACGSADGSTARLQVQIDTLGDTIRVQNLTGSIWGDSAHLEPVASLGVADGPEELMLGRVRSLAIGPAGEIYLMDSQVPALRKYAADGSYLMTIGREGSGPGEYRQPDGGLAVLSDGRVVLRDPGNGRFAIYDADGTYLTQWPVRSGFNTGRKLYRTSDDQLYTMVLLETDLPPWQWTYGLSHYTPEGMNPDTIRIPKWNYEPPMVRGESEGNSSTNYVPFSATAPWSLSAGGAVVTGIGDTYAFSMFRAADTIVQVTSASLPIAVAHGEGAEQRRQVTWDMNQNFPGWRWNGIDVPATKPAFTDIVTAEDGRIWVKVSTPGQVDDTVAESQDPKVRPELRWVAPVAFDVFEPTGEYVGHVRTPDGFQIYPTPVVRADTVWAVAIDPVAGIPQVVRYTIRR